MSDKTILTQYDHLLDDNADVAAIVIRESLRPVQGVRGVFFPPTFAGIGQGRKSDYHIDRLGPRADDPEGASRDGSIVNRCTVDSVPSQANRLESRLLRYSGKRIPKVTVSGSRVGERPLDLLEIGHRVADAAIRYTANGGFKPFEEALRAYVNGDAAPLARLAPTSLVFGHWDSRDSPASKATKSKARRLIRSEIVAYNVARVSKRSQYWSSIDPEVSEDLGKILAEAKEAASHDPETKNPASQLGMTDVPAPESPGGVIAFGLIERTTIIALSGLRSLVAFGEGATSEGTSETLTQAVPDNKTLALRRYLFALALAAAPEPGIWDLREGCILVQNSKPPAGNLAPDQTALTSALVKHNGEHKPFSVPPEKEAEKYLEEAAKEFFGDAGPKSLSLAFDPSGARDAVKQQGGGGDEPKNKKDLIAALKVMPEYADKEAELKRKKLPELQELWRSARTGNEETTTGEEQQETRS